MIPRLPVLNEVDRPQSCQGCTNLCGECALYKKECAGCSGTSEQDCYQSGCLTSCNSCHGDVTARGMTGVCRKSPLRSFAIDQIKTFDSLTYTKRPKLDFEDERIPILLDRHHKSPAPVNAIGIHRVYSMKKGWKSRDMKDYLQLDKKTKLFLLTIMYDNHLDNFMDKRWYDDVEEVGFSFWLPLLFSTFVNEANMQKVHSLWRTMQSLSDSGAHAVPFTKMSTWRINFDEQMSRALMSVPNLVLNLSQGSEDSQFQKRFLGYTREYGKKFGTGVSWLFQGVSSKKKRELVRSLLPTGTACYFFITPKAGARRTADQYGWYDETKQEGGH